MLTLYHHPMYAACRFVRLCFGEYGEGYVRIALVENVHRIRQAVRNIKTFFAASGVNSVQRIPSKKRASAS